MNFCIQRAYIFINLLASDLRNHESANSELDLTYNYVFTILKDFYNIKKSLKFLYEYTKFEVFRLSFLKNWKVTK